jgi:hypothetical protein
MDKLREALKKEEDRIAKSGGFPVAAGPGGPVAISIIRALVETIEEQEKRIAELEKRLAK